jgi:anti-anti-sigma factor
MLCHEEIALANAANEKIELTELVRGQDQRLLDQVEPLVRQHSLVLDLHSVERIDAAGITALISLYRSACDAGHLFAIKNASARVAEILALVGLDRILLSQDLSQNTTPCAHLGVALHQSAA